MNVHLAMSMQIVEYIGASGVIHTDLRSFPSRLEKPRSGDYIYIDPKFQHYPFEEKYAVIQDVETGYAKPGQVHVCCQEHPSVFMQLIDGKAHADISGGPFTVIDMADLSWAGELKPLRFWNWGNNTHREGNGVSYTVERPVWVWIPTRKGTNEN